MYYEEKFIGHRWFFRHDPKGDWTEFTKDNYVRRIASDQKRIAGLQGKLIEAQLREKVREAKLDLILEATEGLRKQVEENFVI